MSKQIHTVYSSSDNCWKVKQAGNQISSGNFETKKQAVDFGRNISIKNNAEHFIHNKDGKIGYKNSYGNDPFPPKDKR